jgi:hypothetical protein
MHPSFLSRALSLFVVVVAGCGATAGREEAPEKVDAMVTWIERVHVEAERSRLCVAESFERLNVLAAGRFDKEPAAMSYAKFVQATDEAQAQSKRFRDVVGPMLSSAQPVFQQWQKDLQTITSDRMRKVSETRYAVAKERYDAITKVAVPAQDQMESYVKALRDHAAFLANDLNASAIDEIQAEVKAVAKVARELDRRMESCQTAARAYVEESSLPAAPGR